MFVQRPDKHTRGSSIVIHYFLKRGTKSLVMPVSAKKRHCARAGCC